MDFIQFRPPDGGEILFREIVGGESGLFAMDADGSNVPRSSAPTDPGEMT